ncbi:unnamed protein product, partial [Musa hybrid cultivar]
IALRRFSLQQAHHLPFSRMEESINSSMNGASCAKDGSASSEESGWTMYFEEFMASEERKAAGGFSSGVVGGFSIVSDAASCVAFDPSSPGLEVSEEKYRKLSLKKKKKRGKGLLDDDSLEDTASSPVNSPKVTDLSYVTLNSTKKDVCRDSPQEDAAGCRNDAEPKEIVGGSDFAEGTNEYAELKKRGLCLVPLSMLANYLG